MKTTLIQPGPALCYWQYDIASYPLYEWRFSYLFHFINFLKNKIHLPCAGWFVSYLAENTLCFHQIVRPIKAAKEQLLFVYCVNQTRHIYSLSCDVMKKQQCEERYNSTHSWLCHYVEMNDQIHAPTAINPGTHSIGDCIVSGLDVSEETNFSTLRGREMQVLQSIG